jgi:hypothetical protein
MTDKLTAAEQKALKDRIENTAHKQRQADELAVFKLTCETIIAAGYAVSLSDGEEWTVKASTDVAELVAAAQTTDGDTLRVWDRAKPLGFVSFVYGNSASEVIADYSCAHEELLKPVTAFCDELEAQGK